MKTFSLNTQKRYQLLDITDQVEKIVNQTGLKAGACLVFVPHSTAAVIMTENEPGLITDWEKILKKIVAGEKFEHNRIDNNADSHLLSGLLGQEKVIPIENGRLVRGTWQQIFLVELDGPRQRKVVVRLLPD